MHIRFKETRVVDDARKGTAAEQRYEAGQVYDLPEPSALRWISRGLAVAAGPEEDQDDGAGDGAGSEPAAEPEPPRGKGKAKPKA